jgi:hypothetical protein
MCRNALSASGVGAFAKASSASSMPSCGSRENSDEAVAARRADSEASTSFCRSAVSCCSLASSASFFTRSCSAWSAARRSAVRRAWRLTQPAPSAVKVSAASTPTAPHSSRLARLCRSLASSNTASSGT